MAQFRPRNTELARRLRNEATPAERRLWEYLGGSRLEGFKFSRQIPVGPYVCDFLCREKRLVVELDGFSHGLRIKSDTVRDEYLQDRNYCVLRFTNEDVFTNVEGVLSIIRQTLAALPTPNPSRKREGSFTK